MITLLFPVRTGALKLFLVINLCYFAVQALDAQWTKSVQFDDNDMALDLDEALTFQKYPTYYQYLEMMQGFSSAYPEICRLDTIGLTTEGRLLLALKISDNVEEDEAEAAFLYTSSMHGDEIVGYVLLLRMADTLLKGYGNDIEITKLVNNLQIWINPLANPDGSFSRNSNMSMELASRKNVNDVDLNRNFPEAARGDLNDTTGREVETRNMMIFHQEQEFTMSANIHSGAEVVNYPWDGKPLLHADNDWYRFISREYADEAKAVDSHYMEHFQNGITHGWAWYEALGTRQDYVSYYLGGREVTLELSNEYLLPASELEYHWNLNQRSLQNYMSQCLYGIRGIVTDLETGDPLRAQIFVENHDSAYSVVHSSAVHGDYYRLIKEGVYDLVVSAPGYHNNTILDVEVTDYQATQLNIQLQPYETSVSQQKTASFRIYPNPAINSFVVEPLHFPLGELELSIYSIDGSIIFQSKLPYQGSGMEISTKQMEPGIYLVRCSMGSLSMIQRLMVIKH